MNRKTKTYTTLLLKLIELLSERTNLFRANIKKRKKESKKREEKKE